MVETKKCWVLTDSRTGNNNQSLALAKMLGLHFEVKQLQYNILGKLPNWFGLQILKNKNEIISSSLPDIIISSGRRCAGIAAALKRKKPGIKTVQIMNCGMNLDDFDALILPKHDKKPARKHLDKTLFINGALSYYPIHSQKEDKAYWENKISHLPSPRVGVLIGGASKGCSFKLSHARELTDKMIAAAKKQSATLMVVTSRRTPTFAAKLIKQQLEKSKMPYLFYDVTSNMENPYRGVLTLADLFIVTGDSVSMCCEAAEMQKPLYIYSGENQLSEKHTRFIQTLFTDGIAKPLTNEFEPFNKIKTTSNLEVVSKLKNLIN